MKKIQNIIKKIKQNYFENLFHKSFHKFEVLQLFHSELRFWLLTRKNNYNLQFILRVRQNLKKL